MKIYQQLGRIALGTRVRFLGETITKDAKEIYSLYNIKMNPKWFPVFYILSCEKHKTITGLAKEIGHSHVSVSKIVAEMIKAKLVKEKASPSDRRRTLVSLTKSGQDVAKKIKNQYLDVNTAIEEISKNAKYDLWKALEEWEGQFLKKSLLQRVQEKKKLRESKDVKIVPYTAKYKKAFTDLNVEWISKYFKMEQADYDALDNPKQYILDRGGFVFVALVKNKPVGVCALIKRKDRTYPFELAKMAVDPSCRGKNIGWLLGQEIIKKAKDLKAKNLYLESNTILTPAISLYEKLGFKKVKGPKTPYERCNIQMELKL